MLKNAHDSFDVNLTDETQQEYWETRLRLFKKLLGTSEKIKKTGIHNKDSKDYGT